MPHLPSNSRMTFFHTTSDLKLVYRNLAQDCFTGDACPEWFKDFEIDTPPALESPRLYLDTCVIPWLLRERLGGSCWLTAENPHDRRVDGFAQWYNRRYSAHVVLFTSDKGSVFMARNLPRYGGDHIPVTITHTGYFPDGPKSLQGLEHAQYDRLKNTVTLDDKYELSPVPEHIETFPQLIAHIMGDDVPISPVTALHGYYLEDLFVGMTASQAKTITETDIVNFAGTSGDDNPMHINQEFAEATFFKGRIAHGMLSAALVSNVLGTQLPGPGAIYMSQSLKFKAPVKIGDTLHAEVVVKEIIPKKKRVVLDTVCKIKGHTVLEGEAVIMVDSRLEHLVNLYFPETETFAKPDTPILLALLAQLHVDESVTWSTDAAEYRTKKAILAQLANR